VQDFNLIIQDNFGQLSEAELELLRSYFKEEKLPEMLILPNRIKFVIS
jgi:hypothetical protein